MPIGQDAGEAWQCAEATAEAPLERMDCADGEPLEVALAFAARPFDLTGAAPWRAALVQGAGTGALLRVVVHHRVADRRSM